MPDVLILAAGRGRRLQPLTDSTPKSLLRVGSNTLVEHHLERLAEQGFKHIVINLAWLGGQIRDYLGDGRRFGLRIRYSDEAEGALETGGGIVNALGLVQSDPFIVINVDILTDFNYAGLDVPEPDDLRLILVPNPPHHPHGDFALEHSGLERGRLSAARADPSHNWTYSGIGCFRRRVFDSVKPGRFPLLPLIERAIAGNLAGAGVHHGRWIDVGSPERLEQARRQAG